MFLRHFFSIDVGELDTMLLALVCRPRAGRFLVDAPVQEEPSR